MNSHWLALLLLVLLLAWRIHAQPIQNVGLCASDEISYFSCKSTNAKWISLCGRKDGLVQYRFGRRGKIELQYPSEKSDTQMLRYSHYMRYRVDRIDVTFEQNGYQYSVFDYSDFSEGAQRNRGVSVLKPNGQSVVINCAGRVQSRMADLEAQLPCDPDGLGCVEPEGSDH